MNLDEARELFAHDRFATEAAGAVIDSIDGDTAVCSLMIDAVHENAGGNVMGGAVFTLADFAFAVATNRDGVLTVTVSSTIEFVGRARGTRLVATAQPEKVGKSLCFYTIRVTDEFDNLVALVSTTGKRTHQAL